MNGDAHGVTVIVVEMDTVIQVQNLDEAISISHLNTLWKNLNSTTLPLVMGK